jgi:hypothetical protein
MPSDSAHWPEHFGARHATKIRYAFRLLEDNLRPEERDKSSPTYRLGWYEHLQANSFRKEDLENFRRFVDEMAERALKRSYHTEAIFPTSGPAGLNAERIDTNVLEARALCESLRHGLEKR